ncbi:hypothetical protein RH915_02890 [Serpentinicella sp. ANB-PHB4]|uniref:hypothetical protein n=1 Tax=Serpentinicella sp. ANB-PHB4 TaxID=3074076 RepID=UPI002865BB1C|nr:hypothetical protein [Serpentinicella sp. ANB-PHB4]MDR5658428.1 hypothetical protein [Serpentinicella sp. ANB-PHB4]
MDWLKKFMYGRSGGDQLSIFLFCISILLTLVGQIVGISLLIMISYIPLGIAIYRIFSKDVQKRRMENYKFAILMSPLYAKFKKVQNRITCAKTHKYFKCTKCKTALRVPKGKGKIMVTCPKCKLKFSRKT